MGAIQVKNVPSELHSQLRARARSEGRSLSDYVLDVLRRDLALPTTREWLAQLERDEPVLDVSSEQVAQAIREGRGQRDAQIERAFTHSD
ncbi:MAG TPA: hypothetical protein VFW38_09400 [Solirubrobacteraceae bacterium]|nr:hypothetical protein [Solirubrobacteraceae bacterium]